MELYVVVYSIPNMPRSFASRPMTLDAAEDFADLAEHIGNEDVSVVSFLA